MLTQPPDRRRDSSATVQESCFRSASAQSQGFKWGGAAASMYVSEIAWNAIANCAGRYSNTNARIELIDDVSCAVPCPSALFGHVENYGSASGWQTLAVTPLARIAKGQTYYVRISGAFCINRATPYGAASGTTGIGSTNGVTSSTAATVTAEGWFEGSSLASSWAGSHLGIQLFGSVVA